MYTSGPTSRRCSLCYALLFTPTHTSSSTLRYTSSSRQPVRRCPLAFVEHLLSSSTKFQRLWNQNEHELIKNLPICDRCYQSIEQFERIRNNIQQLKHERQILTDKIEHSLSKRASILQARRQRTKIPMASFFNYQRTPLPEDDDTEEGEEKSRTVSITNGHEHALPTVQPSVALVGAKRRKCSIANKIRLENKCAESSQLLNQTPRSNSPISYPMNKVSSTMLFGAHSPTRHRSPSFSPGGLNGHDLTSLGFTAACKSLALQAAFTSSSTSASPFLDPTTGALIAIVSSPHHASLLASQHQQLLQSSSAPPSSIHSADEQEAMPVKPLIHVKKFPCALCGRDFSNKSNLNRHHSIVHVALRNFECARCPKKFKLRQGLKTHMQRCHGVSTDQPTFVLQKHHMPNYPRHSSSSSLIAQTNK